MQTSDWEVHFKHGDKSDFVLVKFPLNHTPSLEEAAQRMRNAINKVWLIPDTPVGYSEPTVFMLNHHGYTITDIREVSTKADS